METIEERAKLASEGYDDDGYSAGLYMGYIEGAKEQKAIDINKACEWLKENTEGGIHPQKAYSFPDMFRKAMEEEE